MPSSALRSILPAIHEAAVDPLRWQGVADAVYRATQGIRTHLAFFDALDTGGQGMVTSGYNPEMIQRFNEYFGAISPYHHRIIRLEPMRPVTHDEMVPYSDLRRTEYHADWLLPQEDISAGGGMLLERGPQRLLVVGGHIRIRDRDRQEQSWKHLLSLLGPVLRHAVTVNRVLADLRMENSLLEQGISPAGASVLVLSDDRRILFANEAAALELLSGDTLRIDPRQRLRICDSRCEEALEAALRRKRPERHLAPLCLTHTAAGVVRSAYLLRISPEILPFAGVDPVRRTAPETVAVLVLPAAQQGHMLMRKFGLTPAEAEVALALHSGQTLAEIAAARKVSIHTVRDQTKTILSKCNVRRQAELVAMVARHCIPSTAGPIGRSGN